MFQVNNGSAVRLQGRVSGETLLYNVSGPTATLFEAILTVDRPNNQTFILGNLSLPVEDVLLAVLPTDEDAEYRVPLPSPHTILHNTSSRHAAAIFNGELVADTFAACSPAGSIAAQVRF